MTNIRDTWNAQADKYNQFDSLNSKEIEVFADQLLSELRKDATKLAEILSPSYCRYKKETELDSSWEEIAQASERILNIKKES